jgi:hypothetical protein
MRTVVLGSRPAELDELLARRHALGQDRFDEVWEGDYHVALAPHLWHAYLAAHLPAVLESRAAGAGLVASGPFNLGEPDNFRVPDAGLHRSLPNAAFVSTAALAIEVVSPGDESWDKFDHYASHGVDEVLIADPVERTIAIFVHNGAIYDRTDASAVLGVTAADLHTAVTWPS